ncbi:putative bifunctional diguanylate cyclase/phosphodiesterase [Marinobacter sp.]|uniref:putative bifunctional diguanylate cyclase/phosphodiesterase n=1 Tax=Marinobacter sp. TaxID=50741 RepID=UPI0038510722
MAPRHLFAGFRARLMITMLAIVFITVASIAGLLLVNLFEAEKSRARDQLSVAREVASELLARRTELLASRLQVVAEDFGFRSTVAAGDVPTITSALANQTARAGADLALVTDNSGKLVANLQGLENGAPAPFQKLLAEARGPGQAADIRTWEGQAWQLIVVPVRGAGLRAWLLAGFLLDDRFASSISNLTGTEVLLRNHQNGKVTLLASSMTGQAVDPDLLEASDSAPGERMLETQRYFSRVLPVSDSDRGAVHLLLLSSRSEALRGYYQLAWDIALLVFIVLIAAAVLVMAMARTLGRPLLQLANFARAIGESRNVSPPALQAGGELKVLADALTRMLFRVREREHQLEHNAIHDELTGLENRKAIDAGIRNCLEARCSQYVVAFTVADFKAINDTLGFAFGDQVIVATGLRLRGQLPVECSFGRTGGNEFMALVPNEGRERLEALIDELRGQAEKPIVIYETPIQLQIHIAVLQLPEQAGTPDEVRRRVNLTLEQARRAESHTAFYQPGGDESHLRELRLIRDLETAMTNGELHMNYQPKIAFDSVRLHQVEALVRWRHAELGFINPEEFIMLAERSGQIHHLTGFIMEQIARDSASWRRQGLDTGVAINLSALDLSNRKLPDLVMTIFGNWNGLRETITFEVTESAVMSDPGLAIQTLERLRALGFRLSVDDFGTGYSSLAQLRSLPVHELKIDKSFVLRLNEQPQDQLIVQSTIDMAHRLGLSVVAEGIENLESWRLLQRWGCNLAQGFFLARPMAPEALLQWAMDFAARAPELRRQAGEKTG